MVLISELNSNMFSINQNKTKPELTLNLVKDEYFGQCFRFISNLFNLNIFFAKRSGKLIIK